MGDAVGLDDERPAGTPYVPATLDDAGLTAVQFRLFCRIARRSNSGKGYCTESVPNIARSCRMNLKTCRAGMLDLRDLGMIAWDERSGSTNRIYPLPESDWLKGTPPKRSPTQTKPHLGAEPAVPAVTPLPIESGTTPDRGHIHPSQSSREPYPIEAPRRSQEVPKYKVPQGEGGATAFGADTSPIGKRPSCVIDLEGLTIKVAKRIADELLPDSMAPDLKCMWGEHLYIAWTRDLVSRGNKSVHCERQTGWWKDVEEFVPRFLKHVGTAVLATPAQTLYNNKIHSSELIAWARTLSVSASRAEELVMEWKLDLRRRANITRFSSWENDLEAFISTQGGTSNT